MKKLFSVSFICLVLLAFSSQMHAQRCYTMEYAAQQAAKDPMYHVREAANELNTQQIIAEQNARKKQRADLLVIPVVVHILYNTPSQNIPDSQVYSQIIALNEDFRLKNADSLPTSHPFWVHSNDMLIEFCLAKVDPNGNPTTGITRTATSISSFEGGNKAAIKSTAMGGKDNWNPTKYLNIWVCNMGNDPILGFATFPSSLASNPDEDGVVIRHTAFGYVGTATAPNDYGRTAVHEVGHWLNLRHIWGDNFCGDDFVSDTRVAEEPNYGCPSFPHNANNSCGTNAHGEMYMNYMDYVDDECMVMFTTGQGNRMRAQLAPGGIRNSLLSSNVCGAVSTQNYLTENNVQLYPNPSSGKFTLRVPNAKEDCQVEILDMLGNTIKIYKLTVGNTLQIDLSQAATGVYTVVMHDSKHRLIQKLYKID